MPLVGMTSEYLPFASVVAITTGVLSSVMRYAAIVTPCAGVEPLMPRALAVPDTVIIAGTFGGASAVVSPPPQPINKEARIAIRIPSCTPSRRVSSCSETHGSGIVRSVHSRGVAYMALSALGFSAMSVLVKLACRTLPTGEVVLARAVLTLVLSFAMVRRAGLSPLGTQRGKLVVRGLLGFAALSCYYLSLARLQLADATTLQNMIAVFTALLAWWILGERVGGGASIATACGVVGVVLVAHPTGADADWLGVTCALVGATFSAFAYVTVRQLARTEHPLVIVLYFPLVATPLAIPWAAYHWV